MKRYENLDPFELGDAIAAEYMDREYLLVLASYSIGYVRALHDVKKTEPKGAEE